MIQEVFEDDSIWFPFDEEEYEEVLNDLIKKNWIVPRQDKREEIVWQ